LRAWATIDLSALQANLHHARQCGPGRKVVAVIKANAYGHGMEEVARAIGMRAEKQSTPAMADGAECLAVATLDEVVRLQLVAAGTRILLLQGFRNRDELAFLIESGVEFVLHCDRQLALLKAYLRDQPRCRFTAWLKVDTGMHRLGFDPAAVAQPLDFLQNCPQLDSMVLMSHFACADGTSEVELAMTRRQLATFEALLTQARQHGRPGIAASMAASAAILRHPAAHFDYLRPGIMLYGCSPFDDVTGLQLGLRPVMSLFARIMAIRDVAAGETIGYGGSFVCPTAMRIGVVSIGYADGYPRAARNGTPVVLHLAHGTRRTGLAGRVSMDMITIDLTGMDDVEVGDRVELWGDQLSVDEVARHANTISYELLCKVTRRVTYFYN
jgi:alanine racemase